MFNRNHDLGTVGLPMSRRGPEEYGSGSMGWNTQPIMSDYQPAPASAHSHLGSRSGSYVSRENGHEANYTYDTSAMAGVQYGPLDRRTIQNPQPSTPKTLGWKDDFKFSDYYNFVVPNQQDPYFALRSEFPASPFTPRTVYLDKEDYHPCRFPGTVCWHSSSSRPVFGRAADLERHYRTVHVHATDDQKERFPCDRANCNRTKDPFTRIDHFRDHLKDFHKEDIGACKGEKSAGTRTEWNKWQQKQATWEAERVIFPDWWRCAKCLGRVYVAKGGWKCETCKRDCEPHRREAREKLNIGPQPTLNQPYTSSNGRVDRAGGSYYYEDKGYGIGSNARIYW